MPIDAMLFGGRRSTVVPLVTEAFDWEHGVFLGSTMSSEKTAAAAGTVGELRFDPFAMLPFCGYNMADYFAHWLRSADAEDAKLPKIFYVNWFRKDADGRFLWPGYGENSRVLAWVFARCAGHGAATETPIGWMPPVGADGIDTRGVDVSDEAMAAAAARRRRGVEDAAAPVPRAPRELRAPAGRAARAAGRARAAPRLSAGAPASARCPPWRYPDSGYGNYEQRTAGIRKVPVLRLTQI